MKKIIWISVFLIMIGTVVFRIVKALNEKNAVRTERIVERRVAVSLATARRGRLTAKILHSGSIVALSEITVYSKVAGKLGKNLVKMGSEVHPEEVVCLINRDEIGYEYKQHEVRCSEKGVVATVFLNPGALVSPITPLLSIIAIDSVRAMIPIPEDKIRFLSIGHPVAIIPDAYSSMSYSGSLTNISPVANPINRTIDVEITLPNPRHRLKPGMFVQAEFVLNSRTVVFLPLASVTEREGKKIVYVVDDSIAHLRVVSVGTILADSVEIQNGVRIGEKVVVRGAQQVSDNSVVSVE